MIDPAFFANLAPYSLQVASIALLAGILHRLLRIDVATIRYAYWRAIAVLCLLLPWLQRTPAPPSPTTAAHVTTTSIAMSAEVIAAASNASTDWPTITGWVIAAGVMGRLLWIVIGMTRLHALRHAGDRAPEGEHDSLQQSIGTHADVRYVATLEQPMTFGVRRPVVLLPEALRAHASDIHDAVLAHELVHVRRRDWAWVVVEEVVRAVLWFHPAMWWLISRIQLAREEVVDATVVALTGRRRSYVEALLTFADKTPLAPAPAFAWRRHLFRRILLISREDVMSRKRLVGSCVVMMFVVAGGTWYAAGAFPMTEVGAQDVQMEPGPLERAANPVTPENPVPRRVATASAVTPPQLAATGGGAVVGVRVTVNKAGSVAEARATRLTIDTKTASLSLVFRNAVIADVYRFIDRMATRAGQGQNSEGKLLVDAILTAAISAAQQWRYDAPFNPPIAFDVMIPVGDAPPPPPPPPPAPGTTASGIDTTGALRVGGNIKVPTKLKDVRPVYSPEAMEQRVQGVVILEVRIDETGRVSDARVLRSIPLLDQAALDAVRQWEFTPTLMNGAPTPIIMTVTVQFSLQ